MVRALSEARDELGDAQHALHEAKEELRAITSALQRTMMGALEASSEEATRDPEAAIDEAVPRLAQQQQQPPPHQQHQRTTASPSLSSATEGVVGEEVMGETTRDVNATPLSFAEYMARRQAASTRASGDDHGFHSML